MSLPLARTVATAHDAGRFLAALHAVPLARVVHAALPPATTAGGRAAFAAFAARSRADVRGTLGAAAEGRLVARLEEAQSDDLFAFTPVLLHADLSPDHILVDPSTGALTGVIDWGDMATGDPALDFAGLLEDVGEGAERNALAAYGASESERTAMLRRAGWYVRLSDLHVLRFGLATDQPEYVEEARELLLGNLLR